MDICIDFDGSCTTHSYPEIGKDIGAVPILKRLAAKGHNLILWTMRCDDQKGVILDDGYEIHAGDFLTQAVDWFKENDIPLYAVQHNPKQDIWTTSPKCYAELFIDDAALGAPLIYDPAMSDRPYLDWVAIEIYLEIRGLI